MLSKDPPNVFLAQHARKWQAGLLKKCRDTVTETKAATIRPKWYSRHKKTLPGFALTRSTKEGLRNHEAEEGFTARPILRQSDF